MMLAFIFLCWQAFALHGALAKVGVIAIDLNGISFLASGFTFSIAVYFVGLAAFVIIGLLAVGMVAFARSKTWAVIASLAVMANLYGVLNGTNALYRFLSG